MSKAPDSSLLSLEEALQRLGSALPPAAPEAVRADRDDPALDRSAMDGAAMRSADGTAPRTVLGTLYAGDPPDRFQVAPGHLRADHDRGLPARRGRHGGAH